MAGMAMARAFIEPSLSFSSTAFSTDLILLFTFDLTEAFLNRLFSLCLLLFIADLCVAKNLPPSLV